MNLIKCEKNEIDSGLQHLINNAKNTSNATEKGGISKPSAMDDNVTLDDITGFSVQYTFEYNNYLLHIFTKTKSYVLKIDDDELTTWLSILASIKDVKKPKFTIGDTVNKVSKIIDEVAAKADEPITTKDTGSNEDTPDDVMCDSCKLPKDSCECEW